MNKITCKHCETVHFVDVKITKCLRCDRYFERDYKDKLTDRKIRFIDHKKLLSS